MNRPNAPNQTVGQREIETQRRVLAFLQQTLGYSYLGHWKDHDGNANVEVDLLSAWLKRRGHSDRIIAKILYELDKAAGLGGSKTLYDANREVYGLLRYGVKVKPDAGEQNVTVWLTTGTTSSATISPLPRKSRSSASIRSGPTSCST